MFRQDKLILIVERMCTKSVMTNIYTYSKMQCYSASEPRHSSFALAECTIGDKLITIVI